jgi:5-enolpyruvylshikimate-3-phosphate synthase
MHTHADLQALKDRKTELTGRIYKIDADLSSAKARYAAGGVGHSFAERSALEAERSRLRLERHEVHEAIESMRATLKPRAQGLLVDELCKALEAKGMHHVVREAKSRVDEQLVEQAE